MSENEQQLHTYILSQIHNIGEVTPASCVKVMEQEPGLLERYLRSCGIRVKQAKMRPCDKDRIKMDLLMEEEGSDQSFEIRFL